METFSYVYAKVIDVVAALIVTLGFFHPEVMVATSTASSTTHANLLASSTQQLGDDHGRALISPSKKPTEGATIDPLSTDSLIYPNPIENISSYHVERFPSKDRKIIAVTYSSEEEEMTVLVDSGGKQLSKIYLGGADGWSPDQSKVYIFLADNFARDGRRHMYYLNRDGSITDPKLPEGVYAMSISPDNQSIAYVKEEMYGSDAADIYLRNPKGVDTLLVKGDKNTFLKLSWSADSKTLFYEKSDIASRPGTQSNWSILIDGAEGSQPVSH